MCGRPPSTRNDGGLIHQHASGGTVQGWASRRAGGVGSRCVLRTSACAVGAERQCRTEESMRPNGPIVSDVMGGVCVDVNVGGDAGGEKARRRGRGARWAWG
jgi:hypothetical protein